MVIIGEKINSTLKSARQAMENRDAQAIASLAMRQLEAGAAYIDVNAGAFFGEEAEILGWLVGAVQGAVSAPVAIDSPNPAAIKAALAANRFGKPIINSITGEKERFGAVLPLAMEYGAGVVALCMDDGGIPETAEGRVEIADRLVGDLAREGVAACDIYIDPMVRPIGTGPGHGVVALETIREVRRRHPDAHIMCGLSNISFGIPARRLMNQAFLVAAMAAGMDGAILDPLDRRLMAAVYAGEALLGLDDYCMAYIAKFREGALDD